jgi:hypothetical protein
LPEVGIDISDDNGAVLCQGELVWSREKLIVLMEDAMNCAEILGSDGWRVVAAGEACEKPMAVISSLRGGDVR